MKFDEFFNLLYTHLAGEKNKRDFYDTLVTEILDPLISIKENKNLKKQKQTGYQKWIKKKDQIT